MRLKTSSLLLSAALAATALPALGATVAPGGATVAPGGAHLVQGFYDPKTGTFKPLVTPNVNPNVTTVTRDGTFVVNLTFTIKSDIPTSSPIYVEVDAGTDDGATLGIYNAYDETVTKELTRTSASAGHVSISIPYSWPHLVTPTKDDVTLTYYVYAGTVVAAGTTFAFGRTSSQIVVILPAIPANGATTTETLGETI